MGVLWLLVIACLLSIFKALHAESPVKEHEFSEDTIFIMNSLFGFRPCLNEDCDSSPLKMPSDTKDHVPQVSAGSEYTSNPPPVISPSPDPVVEYCLPVHTSTLRDVSMIEEHHSDIKDVRLKVVEEIVAYVAQYSVLDAENCIPAVKLLDLILLAVQSLRYEYVGDYVTTCNYTDVKEKSQENPDPTKDASTTAKYVDLPSVTPDSVSTETALKQSSHGDEDNSTDSQIDATVKPCPETSEEIEEIIVEDYGHDFPSPLFVGSVRGIPGVHFPNYTDVPVTSFSCADKKYIPGFYADLETGCQVFHVCYEHRRESFLCPIGTIFNQPILACDYWYSSNCSLATAYYEINAKEEQVAKEEEMNAAVGELITVLVESKHEKKTEDVSEPSLPEAEVDITKFLPVKAKVTEFTKPVTEVPGATTVGPQALDVDGVASQIFNKMVSSATSVVSKSRGIVDKISESTMYGSKLVPIAGGIAIKPVIAKAKLSAVAYVPATKIATAKAAAPIVVKTKLAAVPLKAAVPVVAKVKSVVAAAAATIPAAKVAITKAAIPVAKSAAIPAAKVAVMKAAVPISVKTKLATVPKVAVKMSAPALKAKTVASAIPVSKSKIVAPALKGMKMKAVSAPLVKAKMTLPLVKSVMSGPVPVVKAKLGTAAAISPLTKKALALGYMKLLKAKKLALLG